MTTDTKPLSLKYRPKTFSEVIGQEAIVVILKEAIKQKKLHHALMLAGPAGTGKTTLARIVAKAMNCPNAATSAEPCNKCKVCNAIDSGLSPDVQEVDAASTRGIDDIRSIQDNAAYAAFGGKFRVYIIDEAHQLTNAAANAFLKTLEEPPPNTIFILATTEPFKLLPTVRSRCQCHNLKPIQFETITQYLSQIISKEGAEIDADALRLLARNAKGGMRDALQFLDKSIISNGQKRISLEDVASVFGGVNITVLYGLMKAISLRQVGAALLQINGMVEQGINLSQVVSGFPAFLRDLCVIKSDENVQDLVSYDSTTISSLSNLAKQHTLKAIVSILQVAMDMDSQLHRAGSPHDARLILETMAMKCIVALAPAVTPPPAQNPKPAMSEETVVSPTPPPSSPVIVQAPTPPDFPVFAKKFTLIKSFE